MTTTDQTALLAAIVANPDEDTPRLIYADWLDESETDSDRAEFIRLQIQLHVKGGLNGKSFSRMNNLLDAHREKWLRVECQSPMCHKGKIAIGYAEGTDCPQCEDTGDIAGLTRGCSYCEGKGTGFSNATPCIVCSGTGKRNPTTFRRGFPFEVGGCRLADVLIDVYDLDSPERPVTRQNGTHRRPLTANAWQPTPWIRRVFTHHGTIRRVPLVGVDSVVIDGAAQLFRGGLIEPQSPYRIPEPLFDAMKGELIDTVGTGVVSKIYNADALAEAVADWIRSQMNKE